jgi:hypothetical protein
MDPITVPKPIDRELPKLAWVSSVLKLDRKFFCFFDLIPFLSNHTELEDVDLS